MTTLKGLTIVAALLAGGVPLAFAQNGPPTGGQPPVAGGAAGGPPGGPYLQAAPGAGPSAGPSAGPGGPGAGTASGVATSGHHATKHKRMSMHSGRHSQMYMHSGSTTGNAAASGGSGTHRGALKTGSAASNQKVLQNQNGYR